MSPRALQFLNIVRSLLPHSLRKHVLRPTNFWVYDLDDVINVLPDLRWSFRQLLRRGYYPDLVIDIGAHNGDWTELVLPIWPNAQYLLIDALSEKREILEKRYADFRNIFVEITLLGSDSEKEIDFHVCESGSSMFREDNTDIAEVRKLHLRTLDSVVSQFGLSPSSVLLKLDVQGAELEVLKGAKEILSKTDFIALEVSTVVTNEGAPDFAQVISFLDDTGFVLEDVIGFHRQLFAGRMNQMDILVRRK